jgi:lactosylceramide 4-alpha-galactosyltransferase
MEEEAEILLNVDRETADKNFEPKKKSQLAERAFIVTSILVSLVLILNLASFESTHAYAYLAIICLLEILFVFLLVSLCVWRQLKFYLVLLWLISISVLAVSFQTSRIFFDFDTRFKISTKASSHSNFFFIESDQHRLFLTTKQLCAIESAARNNPNAQVQIYTLRAGMGNFSFLLDHYSNLNLIKTTAIDFFRDTPLFEWYLNSSVAKPDFEIEHVSDAMRVLLLFQHGGVYSDLDTITLRSFERLLKFNGVGYMPENDQDSIGNGILIFKQNHILVEFIIKVIPLIYDKTEWTSIGPSIFKQALRTLCHMENFYQELTIDSIEMAQKTQNDTNKCSDLVIYPQRYFYPFNWFDDMDKWFESNSTLVINELIDTYSVHFYGKMSNEHKVTPGHSNLYDFLAASHCQRVYDHVRANRLVFE